MRSSTLILALACLAPLPAEASVSFRFLWAVPYEDSGKIGPGGLTEDFWTSPAMYAALRGAFMTIWKPGTAWSWSGVLTDGVGAGEGSGYTPTLTPSGGDAGTYNFIVWSDAGVVQDIQLNIWDAGGFAASVAGQEVINSGGAHDIYIVGADTAARERVFDVYAAVAWALHHHDGDIHDGGVGAPYIPFHAYVGTGNQSTCGTCSLNGIVYLKDGATNNKFIIAHELGHAVGHKVTSNIQGGSNLVFGNDPGYNPHENCLHLRRLGRG